MVSTDTVRGRARARLKRHLRESSSQTKLSEFEPSKDELEEVTVELRGPLRRNKRRKSMSIEERGRRRV